MWTADIVEVISAGSQILRFVLIPTSKEDAREHDMLYQQCYSCLREVKQTYIESKKARFCAQIIERAVEGQQTNDAQDAAGVSAHES